jgi:hypothetical protein
MYKIISTLALSTSLFSMSASAATILYQNDFDSLSLPTYTTVFGSAEVVGPVLGNATNSLAFNSAGNSPSFYYDQIQYGIDTIGSPYQGTSYQNFNVSFDIATDGLIGTGNQFAVLFDTPEVRNLIFGGDGSISVQNFGSGASSTIGSYVDKQNMQVNMNFDIGNNQWDIFLDNTLLYSDAMDASLLRSIRFSQGAKFSDQIDFNATAYLDNINISAVPVPAAVWLFGSGLLCLAGFKRRKSTS